MGWIGSALIVFGSWQIGHKRRWGFLLAILGSACWATVGISLCRPDMIAIELLMSFVALRNFLKWGRNIKTKGYRNSDAKTDDT